MECCYLARSSLGSLEQDVKQKIELGWEPIGSVILEQRPPGELSRWVQTMYRGLPSCRHAGTAVPESRVALLEGRIIKVEEDLKLMIFGLQKLGPR